VDQGAVLDRDEGWLASCAGCGWSGPAWAIPLDESGVRALAPGCPRCGAPVEPRLPDVAEILGARQDPEPPEA
jgi:hypothetical protein